MNLETIGNDDMIGAVLSGGKWRYFVGTFAEWVMDYPSYDSNSKPDYLFRNGIDCVDENNIDSFCDAMSDYELTEDNIRTLTNTSKTRIDLLYYVIDADNKVYISDFWEIDTHEYVPTGWKGYAQDPMDYVPQEVKELWRKNP